MVQMSVNLEWMAIVRVRGMLKDCAVQLVRTRTMTSVKTTVMAAQVNDIIIIIKIIIYSIFK